ncbi:hypothetical protein GCM10027294_27140 [Marinactinospora endophytica]
MRAAPFGTVVALGLLTGCSPSGEPPAASPSSPAPSPTEPAAPSPSASFAALPPQEAVGAWSSSSPTSDLALLPSAMSLEIDEDGQASTSGAPLEYYVESTAGASIPICLGEAHLDTDPATLTLECVDIATLGPGDVEGPEYEAELSVSTQDGRDTLTLVWEGGRIEQLSRDEPDADVSPSPA